MRAHSTGRNTGEEKQEEPSRTVGWPTNMCACSMEQATAEHSKGRSSGSCEKQPVVQDGTAQGKGTRGYRTLVEDK
jgi:hypothetical protein